jgi:alkaline phosphatase D
MHAAAPWLVTWDDHEVANNYAGLTPSGNGPRAASFPQRRAGAYKAYYEHMPLRRASLPKGPDMQLYRRLQFGRLADFFILDTRQYRTDQPCGDGLRVNCAEALSPDGTILGTGQRDWLLRGLDRSAGKWNVLAQGVMFARLDLQAGPEVGHGMDHWAGYEMDRRRVLKHFATQKISNPIVLTGDVHSNWANELIADFDQLDSRVVGVEFAGTSISSGGDGGPALSRAEQYQSENPFVKFYNSQRGYVRCEVTPEKWHTDFRIVEKVSTRGAPVQTCKSFVIESGRPKLVPA